jgi:protein TonB
MASQDMLSARRAWAAATLAGLLSACGSPPPPAPPALAPASASPPAAVAPPVESAPTVRSGAVRLAPRDPVLEAWKRDAARRIHEVNQKKLFEGRPHHLLQAVIVVEATVDRSGQVVASRILRSPNIKSLDQMALASLKASSPLPAPPASLLTRGQLRFSETWLVQNDGRFQVRTLALPQE